MRLRLALAALAVLVLPGCDLLDNLDGFFSQPTAQELESLRDLVGCEVEAASTSGSTTGTLSAGDCTLGDGSFADYYALKLSGASDVSIELDSDDFDAYLVLFDDDGETVDDDDDGGGDTDALIARRMSAGLYLIAANSFFEGETGSYTLRVRRVETD